MKQLIVFFATGAYIGYFPAAPGTFATFAASLGFILFYPRDTFHRLIITAVIIPLATIISTHAERIYKKKDDQKIVIDEFAGYLLSVSLIPKTAFYIILSIILFRIFDILKPLGIKHLQHFKSGLGIVADDCGAGLLSLVVMSALTFILH